MSSASFGPPDRTPRTAPEKAVRFVVAAALLVGVFYGLYGSGWVEPNRQNLTVGGIVLLEYLLVAYFADLEPDYENLGYDPLNSHAKRLPVQGLFRIDDPFQWADDVSRDFLLYRLLLSPGRFITIALSDPLFFGRGRRRR